MDQALDFTICLNCTGYNLRRASRAVSQLYDDMLRPSGLRGTQFSLLAIIKLSGPVVFTQLSELTMIDRTTLTRNLAIMQGSDLVKICVGSDRRTRHVSITEHGLTKLEQAYPLWLKTQNTINAGLSVTRLEALRDELDKLIETAKIA